ncbi:hypothetical protein FAGKG844_680002 [Frankia sp. AgKG'84/4]
MGVVRADHSGDAGGVGGGPGVVVDAVVEKGGQAAAEQDGAEEEQFSEGEGVGGEQELAERGEFEGLREERGGTAAGAVHREAKVEVHVPEDLREIRRLSVVRVAVQQQHADARRGDRPQQAGEQQRVAAGEVKVAVAITGVDLHWQPGVHAAPDEERVQHRVVEADRRAGPDLVDPGAGGGGDRTLAGPPFRQVQSGAVGGDGLHRDRRRVTSADAIAHRVGEVADADLAGEHVDGGEFGDPFEAQDVEPTAAGEGGEFGGAGQRFGLEAGVHAERGDARGGEQPPVDLLVAEFGPTLQVGLRVGVRRQVEDRRAPATQSEPDLAVEDGRPGRAGDVGLGEHGLELGPGQVTLDEPVTVVVDERVIDDLMADKAMAGQWVIGDSETLHPWEIPPDGPLMPPSRCDRESAKFVHTTCG